MQITQMKQEYQLHRDPVFYVTMAFFALITTALPAVLGQPRFLPLVQAVALTAFLLVPLRRRALGSALTVVFLWLALSMATIFLLTWLAPNQVELAFEDGFFHRAAVSEWYYANSPLPASFASQPIPSLVEIAGVLLGSLLTGGLVGAWFLVKLANLAAFSAAALALTLRNPLLVVISLPPWSWLQIVGAGGLVVLLAEPLLSRRFAAGLRALAHERLRPLLIFGAIYLLGVILELVLPAFWHFTAVP